MRSNRRWRRVLSRDDCYASTSPNVRSGAATPTASATPDPLRSTVMAPGFGDGQVPRATPDHVVRGTSGARPDAHRTRCGVVRYPRPVFAPRRVLDRWLLLHLTCGGRWGG